MYYSIHILEIRKTDTFIKWYRKLRDFKARGQIAARLTRIEVTGHFGDCESVGNGVFELRFHVGPGYRIYYTRVDEMVVLLLAGGDKSTQNRDIKKARELANEAHKI